MILTQQKLIEQLRAHDIRVGPQTIHVWVRAGCPTKPGWKKPRFILAHVLAWLEESRQTDPLELEVRDRLFHKSLKRTG